MKSITLLLFFAAVSSLAAAELTDWKLAGPLPNATVDDCAAARTRAAKFIAGDLGETQDYSTPASPGQLPFHYIWNDRKQNDCTALAATVVKIDKPGFYCMEVTHDCDLDIYVNGEKVYSKGGWNGGQKFFPEFKAGDNLLTLKNPHHQGWWGVYMKLLSGPFDKTEADRQSAEVAAAEAYERFSGMRPYINGNTVIPLGRFGGLSWNGIADLAAGLRSSWYNEEMQEVDRADLPGRYFLKLEGTVSGVPYLHYFDFYAVPENWLEDPAIKANLGELTPNPWQDWKLDTFPSSLYNLNHGLPMERLAIPAALLELRSDRVVAKLAPPERLAKPAPELRTGTEAEAGVPAGTADRLDAIMKAWYDDTGEPFHTICAKNGVIFYSKSYGNADETRVCWLASISKFLTGALYARFIDQNILDPDRPMSNELPVLAMLTPRHCFYHLSGISGGGCGGLTNIYLDQALLPLIDTKRTGTVCKYNGTGYNLLGLQMMIASGTSIDELYRKSYYEPLGITDMNGYDQGGGYRASTADLAKFAQMMLNRGSYGNWKFFGEETYKRMLPEPVAKYFPKCRTGDIFGMGLLYFGPEVDGRKRLLGHGASNGSLFVFNPEANAFIVQAREDATTQYPKYSEQILKLLAELK